MQYTSEQTYTTATLCEMFNISRSTLFRWERQGKLPSGDPFPPVSRDVNGQRQYSWKHRAAIAKYQLKRRFEQIASAEDQAYAIDNVDIVWEQLSLYKFIELRDSTGLRELSERPTLAPDIIHQLLREATKYHPSEEMFCQIVSLVYNKACSHQTV